MGLVLTRRKNESVNVGSLLKVKVLEIRGDKVRLHFEAPEEVRVMRSEIDEEDPQTRPDTNRR